MLSPGWNAAMFSLWYEWGELFPLRTSEILSSVTSPKQCSSLTGAQRSDLICKIKPKWPLSVWTAKWTSQKEHFQNYISIIGCLRGKMMNHRRNLKIEIYITFQVVVVMVPTCWRTKTVPWRWRVHLHDTEEVLVYIISPMCQRN